MKSLAEMEARLNGRGRAVVVDLAVVWWGEVREKQLQGEGLEGLRDQQRWRRGA